MLSEAYVNRFAGIGRLYGQAALNTFAEAHVVIVGIGGVGTWVAESLARSGIGQITLIDSTAWCLLRVWSFTYSFIRSLNQ
mgnify:CR=1 FL=1